MEFPFETLFALAAGALILSLTVATSLSRRDRRIPIRVRRDRD
jgi:hypothetical protein